MNLARRWLEYCRSHHPYCHVPSIETSRVQLIDCHTKTVVQRFQKDYVALSHVWGSVTLGNVLCLAPKTIRDIIYLTRELGFRYLWVDQYCIDQDNEEARHSQIQQTDAVYRNAVVKIVAARGDNADSGLAGVQLTSRSGQPVLSIGGINLVNSVSHPHHAIAKSVCSTRGWTL